MKTFIILILISLLVFIGWQYLIIDNGYVLIEFLGYSFESSVPILIGCMIILYFIVRIIVIVWKSPKIIKQRITMRGKDRSLKLLNQSLNLIARGSGSKAAKKLDGAISADELNDNAYLYRMNLAADEKDFKTIVKIADKLIKKGSVIKTYVLFDACRLLIKLGEYSLAQKYADELIQESPRNPEVKNLLFIIKAAVGDPSIIKGLPEYAKTIDQDLLAKTILDLSRKLKGEKTVEDLFGGLPRSLDKKPDFITAKCELWIAKGDHIKAGIELKKSIPIYWDKNHILLYSRLSVSDSSELSSRLESWLNDRPRDHNLWLTASRIAQREGLWSKAKQCIERSIEFKNNSGKQTELALILAQLGEKDEAFNVLNKITDFDDSSTYTNK